MNIFVRIDTDGSHRKLGDGGPNRVGVGEQDWFRHRGWGKKMRDREHVIRFHV